MAKASSPSDSLSECVTPFLKVISFSYPPLPSHNTTPYLTCSWLFQHLTTALSLHLGLLVMVLLATQVAQQPV